MSFCQQSKKNLRKFCKTCFVVFLHIRYRKKVKADLPKDPKRILICNIASFGDVVISTAILPPLKKKYPHCEFGFLTSSKTAEVLQAYPDVQYVHSLNHWYTHREKGIWAAWIRYVQQKKKVIQEISSRRYDLVIDLYPVFPMTILPVLAKTNIPVRVGYEVEGCSKLLTHPVPSYSLSKYVGCAHLHLLEAIGFHGFEKDPLPSYRIPPILIPSLPKEYGVVHMGTAHFLKEWDDSKWVQVVELLKKRGETIVLTGRGEREKKRCDFVSSRTGSLNFCDRFRWMEFASVIQHAKFLISVDSVAVHLAAAVKIPCVVLFTGMNSISMWKPPYPLCKAIMRKVSCAPCLQSRGCLSMSCIQDIEPKEVIQSLEVLCSEGKKFL